MQVRFQSANATTPVRKCSATSRRLNTEEKATPAMYQMTEHICTCLEDEMQPQILLYKK